MRKRLLTLLLGTLLVAAPLSAQTAPAAPAAAKPARPPAPALTPAQHDRLMALGEKYVGWFLAGRADSLAAAMDAETLAGVGGFDAVAERLAQFAERAGMQGRVLEKKLNRRNGQHQYWYESEFANAPNGEPMVIRLIVTVEGKIIGIGLNPKSAAPAPDPG